MNPLTEYFPGDVQEIILEYAGRDDLAINSPPKVRTQHYKNLAQSIRKDSLPFPLTKKVWCRLLLPSLETINDEQLCTDFRRGVKEVAIKCGAEAFDENSDLSALAIATKKAIEDFDLNLVFETLIKPISRDNPEMVIPMNGSSVAQKAEQIDKWMRENANILQNITVLCCCAEDLACNFDPKYQHLKPRDSWLRLRTIPTQLRLLTNLKELVLFCNHIETLAGFVPNEKLTALGLNLNPIKTIDGFVPHAGLRLYLHDTPAAEVLKQNELHF
ncbi:MAG: hypothetical protein KGJ02_01885 [Verrucomicrobiota bacterium]|nr:hypothetical protein [Verrucomicrobiota bacterium]